LVKQIVKEASLEEKQYPSRKIQTYISTAKNAGITPQKYESYIDSHFKEIVKDVYYKYAEKLKQNNALDFDDLL
jgi:DNA helicase-2/ATP-dependent DNA helicase PcrA